MNTTANQILSPMNYSDRVSKIDESNNILKKSFQVHYSSNIHSDNMLNELDLLALNNYNENMKIDNSEF